jgi:hypothetical protein
MTVPAAHPGMSGPRPVEHVQPHAGDEALAGCPACHDPEHLELIETVHTRRPIASAYLVHTATVPEVEPVDEEWMDRVMFIEKPVVLLGVRCTKCRWGYEGPNPLATLTPVPA